MAAFFGGYSMDVEAERRRVACGAGILVGFSLKLKRTFEICWECGYHAQKTIVHHCCRAQQIGAGNKQGREVSREVGAGLPARRSQ